MVLLNNDVITERDLLRLLDRAYAQAVLTGRTVLASRIERVADIDPLRFFSGAAEIAADRFFWQQPSQGFALVGVGDAWTTSSAGSDRFTQTAADWRELLSGSLIERDDETPRGVGPLLFGGFAFDPVRPASDLWYDFPDARLVLPRMMLTRSRDGSWLTINAVVSPESDPEAQAAGLVESIERLLAGDAKDHPHLRATTEGYRYTPLLDSGEGKSQTALELSEPVPAEDWQRLVTRGTDAVHTGLIEKVVLAREVRVHDQAGRSFDIHTALARLREQYPTCYVFAVTRGERVFLGATPERLVRLDGREVQATSLAGSRRRGATEAEDAQQGRELLESAKDRIEHDIVVRVLCEGLVGLCEELEHPAQPELLSVSNVHHLHTPVTARLRPEYGLLDLVERLHPTPAVGGFPKDAAMRFIREHESLDRGWYASPVGWLDVDGGGEFAVALRSALVEGANASLFAGCGIVADSEPEQEYAESWLKLRPMLAALGGSEPL